MAQKFSNTKQKELIEQFLNEETLFLLLYDELNELIESQNIRFSIAEIWFDAKELVKAIFKSKHPDKMLAIHYHQIEENYKQFNPMARDFSSPMMPVLTEDIPQGEQNSAVNMIVLCALCMLYYESYSDTDGNVVDACHKLLEFRLDEYESITGSWFEKINQEGEKDNDFYNYDYIHDVIKTSETEDTKMKNDSQENNGNEKTIQPLKHYMDDPIYRQCYNGLVCIMSSMAIAGRREYTSDDYAAIYAEADGYVNEALQSDFPEMVIANIQARLRKKYTNNSVSTGGLTFTAITAEWRIGCLIEMVFIIALCDKMKEKSQLVMDALQMSRTYFENTDMPNPYVENPMWKLVAERIPKYHRKQVADCEIEIEKLNGIIDELNKQLEDKDAELAEKDKEVEYLKLGWEKDNGEVKASKTKKRILILKHLTHVISPLVDPKREQFIKLAKFMTGADEGTINNNIKPAVLLDNETLEKLKEEFPILK